MARNAVWQHFLSLRSQFFTIRTGPKVVNNLFFSFSLSNHFYNCDYDYEIVTVTVGGDRKDRTALRTNHITGLVTVPS